MKTALLNAKFGKLTPIEKIQIKQTNKRNRSYYICKCDCGKTTHPIDGSKLKNGHTRSCGCILDDMKHIPRYIKPVGESALNSLILSYKNNAKKKNIVFNLTREQMMLLFQGNCHYCNIQPCNTTKFKGHNGQYVYNGIDRLDNTIGYVPDNVVSCCKKCNYIKNNMSYNEFIEWIKTTHAHLKL